MIRLFPAFALALVLSTGWWGTVVRATAAALGLNPPATAEQSAPPPPPDNPTTDSACSMDPWGCPRG
jgi:hypothetical protein